MVFNLKGQTTIEFLIVIMIMLVYLQGFIMPSQQESFNAANDAKKIVLAETTTQEILNSVKEIAAFKGESKKSLELILASGIKLQCDGTRIRYTVTMEGAGPMGSCPSQKQETGNIVCTKSIDWPVNGVSCTGSVDGAKRIVIATINKSDTGINVTLH